MVLLAGVHGRRGSVTIASINGGKTIPPACKDPETHPLLSPDYGSTMTPRNLLLVRGFSTLRPGETGCVL